jgi:hypothetical protein
MLAMHGCQPLASEKSGTLVKEKQLWKAASSIGWIVFFIFLEFASNG